MNGCVYTMYRPVLQCLSQLSLLSTCVNAVYSMYMSISFPVTQYWHLPTSIYTQTHGQTTKTEVADCLLSSVL